ncbi:MAG: hypothetical protein CES88_02295 [Halobacteriovorax sp. JY17]|nr:MAG: hypothetical protein CES88_02295 [Halobacteriovorax sp. JY17]
MDIKNFFNILLLAISLTTILVTLVSYIVFKLRLASAKRTLTDDPLEGAFFRRFSPLIQKSFNEQRERQDKDNKKKVSFKVKFVSLFLFLFTVIASLLLFEDYFSYRRVLSDRVLSASNFRELVKQGHLKTYTYTPREESAVILKMISRNTVDQREYLLGQLRKQNFCIISTPRALRFSKENHSLALLQWKDFFKRNNLNYRVRNSILESSNCLSIYPHILSLSNSQRKVLKESKYPFLVTGGFGEIDGLGGEVETSLLEDLLGRKIQSEDSALPTLISSERDYLWEIDGGSYLPWLPIDISFAHVTSREANILSSNYNGRVLRKNSKLLSREVREEKLTWTSLDPIDHPYSDLVFLNIFAKMKSIPVFKIANHRDSKTGVSFVYRQDQPSDDLKDARELFAPLKGAWTLFTNNFSYEDLDARTSKEATSEVAILTSPNHNFEKLDNRSTFNLVENVRLKLEELSFSGVKGLTSHNDFLSDALLDASDQNKLTYLYGTTKEISYSPVLLSGLNYFLVPKMFKSLRELLDDKSLSTADDLVRSLEEIFSDSQSVGGLAIYDLSSLGVSDYMAKEAFEEILSKVKDNSLGLGEIIKWRRAKENLRIAGNPLKNDFEFKIENSGNRDAENFRILLERDGKREVLLIDKVNSEKELQINASNYLDR